MASRVGIRYMTSAPVEGQDVAYDDRTTGEEQPAAPIMNRESSMKHAVWIRDLRLALSAMFIYAILDVTLNTLAFSKGMDDLLAFERRHRCRPLAAFDP